MESSLELMVSFSGSVGESQLLQPACYYIILAFRKINCMDVWLRTGMEYRYMPPIRRLIEESDSRCPAYPAEMKVYEH